MDPDQNPFLDTGEPINPERDAKRLNDALNEKFPDGGQIKIGPFRLIKFADGWGDADGKKIDRWSHAARKNLERLVNPSN